MDRSLVGGGWPVALHVGVAILLLLTFGAVAVPAAAEGSNVAGHITPRSGPAAGGTNVIIVGTGFSGVTHVFIGDVAVLNFTINGDGTQISITTFAHNPGPVAVSIVLANTTRVVEGVFTFTGIIAVRPTSGPTSGGTPFAVIGFGFSPDATVSFGGVLATNVQPLDGSLTGVTPAHAAGAVDVTVTNHDGTTLTQTSAYTYTEVAPSGPPKITEITPSQYPATNPGTSPTAASDNDGEHHYVAINGENFQSGATVTFDNLPAVQVTFANANHLYVIPPPHAAGVVPVTVTNPDTQSFTLSGVFTYVSVQSLPLSIHEISPSSGPIGANEARLVNIEGTDFRQGTTVTFGTRAAANVTIQSSEHLTANAPNQGPGTVDVTVTNPDNTSVTKVGAYTYFTPVRVQSINPTSGPASGNTPVTIVGSNFQQGATVAFDDMQATNVAVNADGTQITATTPAHHVGVATMVVTNPDHSRGYLPFGFSFTGDTNPPPNATLAIREIHREYGPTAGGVHVTIYGSGFTAGMTVTFDTVAATQVQVLDRQTIVAVTPAHAAGSVSVTVSDGNGHSVTKQKAYLYVDPTSSRQVWETPGVPDDTPTNAPSDRLTPGGSGPGGATGTAGTAGANLNPAPTTRK